MMRHHSLLTAGVVFLLLAFATPSKADMIVRVGNLNLASGATGSVDVTISSPGGTDQLDMFGAEFRITTAGSTSLQLLDPPSDLQLFSKNYVFPLDDSTAASVGPPSGAISSMSSPNDTYIGGDGTWSRQGATVSTLGKLLVTLNVTAGTSNPPVVGDTFTISLVNSVNTFFWDPSGIGIPFSGNAGKVSIVPEPGTGVMLFGLAAILGLIARKRLRRHECP